MSDTLAFDKFIQLLDSVPDLISTYKELKELNIEDLGEDSKGIINEYLSSFKDTLLNQLELMKKESSSITNSIDKAVLDKWTTLIPIIPTTPPVPSATPSPITFLPDKVEIEAHYLEIAKRIPKILNLINSL